jgi:aspartate/tyrosine/aromatic aminotransferase
MFKNLEMAPPDPILGLTDAFNEDPNPRKINLGVGVYKDASGKTPVMNTVKKAEERILRRENTKNYLPIGGSPEFGGAVQTLLFPVGDEIVQQKRALTAQTPGGTAALRVAADFLKTVGKKNRIWVSEPTWPNHSQVFRAAGLEVSTYPYYDAANRSLDGDSMIQALGRVPEGDVLLLHGCCHNPTGADPDPDQWKEISSVAASRRLILLVDLAYQGLGQGLEEDAAGIRVLCGSPRDILIASSFSKNFGLYRERVGALTLVSDSAETTARAFSHVKATIRANYSNPPSHGGAIVATILNDPELRAEWEGEVRQIRDRIRDMRLLFANTLKAKGVRQDFSFISRQNGMFSFSGLNKQQVETLRKKHALYVVGSGRINVAGMTVENMDTLCAAIADVL